MRSRVTISLLVSMTLVLAACTRTASAPTDTTATLATTVLSHCTDINAPELGEGSLCIDNGFRVKSDDFSFKNWGRSNSADANVTAQTLIDLFGHSNVCTPGTPTECVLRPTMIQKLEQWNNALSGGRCEGLATLSNRLFLKYDHPSQFSPAAQRTVDIEQTSEAFTQSTVYWWATQFLPEVTDRAAQSRTKSPLALVDDLIQGLANGVGYTLGMYFGSSGHAVTPFAVTHRNGTFVVHVYDNNHPGERREILVDATQNTWSYPDAVTRIDGSKVEWTGSKGTFELIPMSARQGPFTCAFCLTNSDDARTVLTIASRDPNASGYVYIRTRDGETLDVNPESIVNTISGATYSVGKGAQNAVATISLPESVTDFDVYVRRVSPVVPAGDVVINLKQKDAAAIQVSGNLAEAVIGDTRDSSAVLAVRESDTTIHAPLSSNARISLALGSSLSRTNLVRDTALVISHVSSETIDVSIKGADGRIVDSNRIDSGIGDTTAEITLELDAQRKLRTTRSAIVPIRVQPQTERSFVSDKARQTTSTTTSVPSSIVISQPD